MRSLKRLFMASAALACLGSAQAVAGGPPDFYPNPGFANNVIGGGSTFFPSVVIGRLRTARSTRWGMATTPVPDRF
jgi:hypothetical protein